MINISDQDVLSYFANRKNRFSNSKGMELGLTAENGLWTYFSLCNHDRGPIAITISTEGDSAFEFITGFKIQTTEDINSLDYTHSWMRYLDGDAEIGVTPLELEATLGFKISNRKTIIFSLDLHFFDEVYEHLTIPEDFERYISDHSNRLRIANENRHKMNRN